MNGGPPAGALQYGIVVAAYPQGNAIDVLLPDSGSRLSNVQVMTLDGSDASGTLDLIDPGLGSGESRWDLTQTPGRIIQALIMSYKGNPVCIGFILPQVCQMTFARKNFRVFRHASDVYSTINATGDTEVYHPSGTYLRIGASPAHEDLTAQDFDGEWAITNNTTAAPYVNLTVANAGVVKATLQIDPSGNVTLTYASLTLNGPVAINGNLTVSGNAAIGSGATGTFTADGETVTVQDGITTNIY